MVEREQGFDRLADHAERVAQADVSLVEGREGHQVGVGDGGQIDQDGGADVALGVVGPGAVAGVDVEEVLDGVAVLGVVGGPLLDDGAQPDGGDAEGGEVVELGGDAGEGAALPAFAAGAGPGIPAPAGRAGGGEVGAVEHGAGGVAPVGEAVDQEE